MLGGLAPRSASDWQVWAQENERAVSFKRKHRWTHATRATGRLDTSHKQARAMLSAGWAPSDAVHGFIRGKSTSTAAASHIGTSAVLAIDLADFYGQISYERVSAKLHLKFDERVCAWIEGACFRDDRLPLGFRTSPVLSNIAFHETDMLIERVAAAHETKYTRWVDDLAFSGRNVGDQLLSDVHACLTHEGWAMNDRKTRFMRRTPYILGLYVGHDVTSPRLPREMKKRLLIETYHFSKVGFEHFSHVGVMSPNRLFGRAAYANVIEPKLAKLLDERIQEGHRVTKRRG